MKKLLTLIIIFFTLSITSQVKVVQFNANWNAANGVKWLNQLTGERSKKRRYTELSG
jgi:hypothetical protein